MTIGSTRVSALTLREDARAIADARAWVREFLDEGNAAGPCIEQAVLIVSELTSNAIRHGSGDVLCELAWFSDDRCFVSVVDFGGGTPGIVEREPAEIGGLGLVIVERLAIEWGVATFDGGKAVFAVFQTANDDDEEALHAVA